MNTAPMPLLIRMHPDDNVAIVANDGGLPAGTAISQGLAAGLTLREKVPQGHKVALRDIAAGQAVLRYNVPVGVARTAIAVSAVVGMTSKRCPRADTLMLPARSSSIAWKPL